uniref:Uncharacterized protein n=1 Tax=Picea glauca TaxID=3330 RepID=A0A117NGY8_PICGL|nr:hypothetical protein ABT39_MTgene5756 [Picea glauca]QHR87681.1 hypothetical protein Q903MT_gene1693 [Picea sitchensis]
MPQQQPHPAISFRRGNFPNEFIYAGVYIRLLNEIFGRKSNQVQLSMLLSPLAFPNPYSLD